MPNMLQRKATIDLRPRPRSYVEKCVPEALNSTGDSARAARVTSMSNNEAFIEGSAERVPVQGLDRAAIESLIAKQYTGLRLLILRRTGDAEVAADLLNEAACTAWEKWQGGLIQRPEEIGGYIFQVAMNLLRNHRRSLAERPDRRAAPEVLGSLPDATEATDRWLDSKVALQVKRILLELRTPRDREILTRFYLQDQDKDAICRDLSLDTDQFDKVLHRARGRLKELFELHGLRKSDLFMFCIV
jgi:RNA polymerase sigma-70 factor, ECF subfamily